MFIACQTFNVLKLQHGAICDFGEIQFAFELTNKIVPEIQNYNFFELYSDTPSYNIRHFDELQHTFLRSCFGHALVSNRTAEHISSKSVLLFFRKTVRLKRTPYFN